MRYLIPALLLTAACGSSSPTAPEPIPTPIASAQIVNSPTMSPDTELSGAAYRLLWEATNTGQGCATGVKGTVVLRDRASAALTTLSWSHTGMVRPGERFPIQACCMTAEVYGKMDGGVIAPTYQWQDIRC